MQKDTPFYCTMCLKQNNTFKMCKDCQKLICSQCDSRLRNICPFCKKNNNFTSVDLNNLQSKVKLNYFIFSLIN
ncbi:MAG: hypothetical protein MJ252_06905 [archaeon]|nr:hypothetical protein [archaeon]